MKIMKLTKKTLSNALPPQTNNLIGNIIWFFIYIVFFQSLGYAIYNHLYPSKGDAWYSTIIKFYKSLIFSDVKFWELLLYTAFLAGGAALYFFVKLKRGQSRPEPISANVQETVKSLPATVNEAANHQEPVREMMYKGILWKWTWAWGKISDDRDNVYSPFPVCPNCKKDLEAKSEPIEDYNDSFIRYFYCPDCSKNTGEGDKSLCLRSYRDIQEEVKAEVVARVRRNVLNNETTSIGTAIGKS